MSLLASVLVIMTLGMLPIGPALVTGLVAGPRHTDIVVATPAPPLPPPVAECDCGVPSSPRGPR
jgi:hypothetical protein